MSHKPPRKLRQEDSNSTSEERKEVRGWRTMKEGWGGGVEKAALALLTLTVLDRRFGTAIQTLQL